MNTTNLKGVGALKKVTRNFSRTDKKKLTELTERTCLEMRVSLPAARYRPLPIATEIAGSHRNVSVRLRTADRFGTAAR